MEVRRLFTLRHQVSTQPSVHKHALGYSSPLLHCSPGIKPLHHYRGWRSNSVSSHAVLAPFIGLKIRTRSAIVRYQLTATGLAALPNTAFKSFASLTGTAFRGPLI